MYTNDEINRDILLSGRRAGQKVIAFAFKGLIKTIPELNKKAANAIKAYNNTENKTATKAEIPSTDNKNTLADLSNDIDGKFMLDVKGKIEGLPSQKYSVDYAAFYDQKSDKTYLLFQGKDMASINKSLQSYMYTLNSQNKMSIVDKVIEIEAAQVAAPALAAAKGIGKAAEAGAKVAKQAINHVEHAR